MLIGEMFLPHVHRLITETGVAKMERKRGCSYLLTTLPAATLVANSLRIWLQISGMRGSILGLCPLSMISHNDRITPASIQAFGLPVVPFSLVLQLGRWVC